MPSIEGKETMRAPDSDPHYRRTRCQGPVVALRVKGSGQMFEIAPDARRIVIGSRSSCEIALSDPYVSALHCVLERRDDGLVVRDRGSLNGTYINGTAIEAGILRPGSVLSVGHSSLIALAEGARDQRTAYERLRGTDPIFREVIARAMRAALTDHCVLVVGETGTGKDLLARAVHEASPRASGPFVAVNCGAISRDLIGSELFGHEKGAFTGAVGEHEGYFVQAEGGTLFLDELGELPPEQQPHLLRVLETRRVRRLGGSGERPVDVRIVAATNRLTGLGTERSVIRLDLFHRLSTVVVALPPLRERPCDLTELVESILDELAPLYGRKTVTPSAWDAIHNHEWPGNVRELYQAVARAVALGDAVIQPRDLFPEWTTAVGRPRLGPLRAHGTPANGVTPPPAIGRLTPYEVVQRDAMQAALIRHRSIRAAAVAMGMAKSTFAERAHRFGLLDPRPRRNKRPTESG